MSPVPLACRRRRPRDPVIGPVGARRALALLVIGDAVLGGAVVGVLLRPTTDAERPSRAVTSTTAPAAAAGPGAPVDLQVGAEVTPGATAPTAPDPATGTSTTSASPTASVPPTTVSRTEPHIAEVSTTVPAAAPSTTVAPSSTAPPPTGAGD